MTQSNGKPPYEEQLEAYLDGQLSADERATFERALANRPDLAKQVEAQSRIDASLTRRFAVGPPAEARIEQLLAASSEDAPAAARSPSVPLAWPRPLAVAGAVAAAVDLRTRPSRHLELIGRFGLDPFLNKKLGNLSGGTKQKVNLVLAFMFESDLILLDEPTAGLDPISLIHLRELLRNEGEKGRTIIVTTHIMSFAQEISDEIIFVLDGRIHFKGSVDRIKDETGQPTLETAIAELLRGQP